MKLLNPKLSPLLEQHRWKRPSNYMGENWYEYIGIVGRSRDSQIIEESNFETALEMLGGEKGEDVVVVCEGHFLVGWVEWLGVKDTATKELKIAEKILKDIENYPILDEDDYSERTYQSQIEYLEYEVGKENLDEAVEWLSENEPNWSEDPDGNGTIRYEYIENVKEALELK